MQKAVLLKSHPDAEKRSNLLVLETPAAPEFDAAPPAALVCTAAAPESMPIEFEVPAASSALPVAAPPSAPAAAPPTRLPQLLDEMRAAAATPLSREARLAFLAALCAALETALRTARGSVPPELARRLLGLAQHEREMLRAGRLERAALGLRSQQQVLLAELVEPLEVREAQLKGSAGLLKMFDDAGRVNVPRVAPPRPRNAWEAAGLADPRESYPVRRFVTSAGPKGTPSSKRESGVRAETQRQLNGGMAGVY